MALVSDDFEWVNMCAPDVAIRGKEAMRVKVYDENFLFPEPFTDGRHETVSALSEGGLVLHERVDWFRMRGREMRLPCAARFVVHNGKVSVWHDYFDLGLAMRQMQEAGVTLGDSQPS